MNCVKKGLSVSNFAWPAEKADFCYDLLAKHGIGAIEIAPNKAFGGWENINPTSIANFQLRLAKHNLTVSSLQGITFSVPDLSLHPDSSQAFLKHCSKVASLLVDLDADYAVFGAVKLRTAPAPDQQELEALFHKAGEIFAQRGKALALEPIPYVYGAAFLNNLTQCLHLVTKVDSCGLVLQFDTANQFLAGDLISANYLHALSLSQHLHISEPDMRFFCQPSQFNIELSHQIKQQYRGRWTVLEMADKYFEPQSFQLALSNFTKLYAP